MHSDISIRPQSARALCAYAQHFLLPSRVRSSQHLGTETLRRFGACAPCSPMTLQVRAVSPTHNVEAKSRHRAFGIFFQYALSLLRVPARASCSFFILTRLAFATACTRLQETPDQRLFLVGPQVPRVNMRSVVDRPC
jgi:hypothetical protein